MNDGPNKDILEAEEIKTGIRSKIQIYWQTN